MKHLFIYRHADATPAHNGQKDHERDLSPRGVQECANIGHFLKQHSIQPDMAVCSTARRTRATLELTAKAMGKLTETQFEETLYLASVEDIFEVLNGLEPNIQAPIIVAHNPGLHEFCQMLAKHGKPADLNILASRFPPATLVLFSLDITDWQEFSLQSEAYLRSVTLAASIPVK